MDEYLKKYNDFYIIFVSTQVGIDNLADVYAKKNHIRREFFGKKKNYDEYLEF